MKKQTEQKKMIEQKDPTLNCGIYRIICKDNRKIYIGSALNISRRFSQHKSALTLGNHYNKHLQSAWNKYGSDSFLFEIVELVSREYLLDTEQKHIDFNDAANTKVGFNQRPKAESNLGVKWSPEIRAKMGAPKKGRKLSAERIAKNNSWERTPEYRAKLSAKLIGNKHSLGYRHPPEIIAKISARSIAGWAKRHAIINKVKKLSYA